MSERGMGRRDFLKGLLAVGAVSTLETGCDVGELGDGFYNDPDKAEGRINPDVKFDETYNLSEVQKKYIIDAVKRELNSIEPVYRQDLAVIKIFNPDDPESTLSKRHAEGSFSDWNDTININGPRLIDPKRSESPKSIDLNSFLSNLPGVVAHEVGHSVDSMNGIKKKFREQGATLYQGYGGGMPDFSGKTPAKEDAAEGFRLYRVNKYAFPFFYFGENPKNRAKYESLRDDTFGGREYAFSPSFAANETMYMTRVSLERDSSNPDSGYEAVIAKLQKNYEALSSSEKDPRLEAMYRYYLLFYLWGELRRGLANTITSANFAKIKEWYTAAKDAAKAVQWESLSAEADVIMGATLMSFNEFSTSISTTKEMVIEKYQSAIDSGHLPKAREVDIREALGELLVTMGDKDAAEKILTPNLAMVETTTADRARNILK